MLPARIAKIKYGYISWSFFKHGDTWKLAHEIPCSRYGLGMFFVPEIVSVFGFTEGIFIIILTKNSFLDSENKFKMVS